VIIDALFSLLFSFFEVMFGLLPAFTPPDLGDPCSSGAPYSCYASDLGAKMVVFDQWLPVQLVVTCLTIVMASLLAVAAVRGVLFVYDRIPGKAS